MKITISTTNRPDDAASHDGQQHNVSIEHPSDDLSIVTVVELVKMALIAWGFAPDSINDYFHPEE